MATTTYELTARYMAEREGVERALVDARKHMHRERKRRAEPYWRYVVMYLERMEQGASDSAAHVMKGV